MSLVPEAQLAPSAVTTSIAYSFGIHFCFLSTNIQSTEFADNMK